LEVPVIKPDLKSVTKAELRAYVVAHPEDKDAFRIFVDRFTAEAPPETFAVPQSETEVSEIDNLIQQRIQQSKINH
jgi:hypothetical protein